MYVYWVPGFVIVCGVECVVAGLVIRIFFGSWV